MPRVPITVQLPEWLRRPVVLTRAALLIGAVVLGLLAATGVLLGALALETVADERTHRSAEARAQLRRDLERQVAYARRDALAARRIARLERPSAADLDRAIRRALLVLRRSPALRRRLERELARPAPPAGPPAPADTTSSTAGPTSPSPTSPTSRAPARRPRRSSTGHHRQGAAAAAPTSSSPASSSPPTGPSPTVTATTPDVPGLPRPSVCTPVLGVNCR